MRLFQPSRLISRYAWTYHQAVLADACGGVVLGIVPWSICRYVDYQAGFSRFVLIITPGQFKYPAVQQYLHDLSSDLGEHIENITSALSLFIEVGKLSYFMPVWSLSHPYSNVSGVPTIRFAQEHGAYSLLNLSTIATFFSSVTATRLRFSFSDTDSPAANAVNAFWFTSLVFSIGKFHIACGRRLYNRPPQPLPSTVC